MKDASTNVSAQATRSPGGQVPRIVRYGSVGMRLIETGPTLTLTADGRTVVAVSERPFAARVLQVFAQLDHSNVEAGRVEAGTAVSESFGPLIPLSGASPDVGREPPFAAAVRSVGPQIGPYALCFFRAVGEGPVSGARERVPCLVTALRDSPYRLVWFGVPNLEIVREVEVQGEIVALAVAPDGERVVVGLAGGEIVRVDADGKRTVLARAARPTQIAFAPSGDRIAVGTVAGLVEVVWVTETKVLVTLRGGRSPVAQVRFTPDESRIVASTSATVFCWPSRGGNPVVVERGKQFVSLLGFTPTGALLTASSEERVASHDLATGRLRWHEEAYGPAIYHNGRLFSARFEAIRELDPETGSLLGSVDAPQFVDALGVVPSAGVSSREGGCLIVAMATGNELRVLDLATQQWSGGAGGHEGEVVNVRFHEDGWFVSGGRDTRSCVWVTNRSTPVVTAVAPSGDPADRAGPAFIDLRRRAVWVGFGPRVVRFRMDNGSCQAESAVLGGPITAVAAIAHSTLVLACTGGRAPMVHLLDAPTAQPVHSERLETGMNRIRLRGDGTLELMGPYGMAVFDPHRPAVVSSTLDSLRARLGDAHRSPKGDRRVEAANWPNPAGGKRGVVWVTELPAGWTLLAGLVTEEIAGRASLSASGRFLAIAHADGHVRILDLELAACIADYDLGMRLASAWFFPDEVRVLVSTPEGQLLEVGPESLGAVSVHRPVARSYGSENSG